MSDYQAQFRKAIRRLVQGMTSGREYVITLSDGREIGSLYTGHCDRRIQVAFITGDLAWSSTYPQGAARLIEEFDREATEEQRLAWAQGATFRAVP